VLQSTPGVVTDRLAVGGNESGQRQGAGSAREIADQAAPTAGAPTGVPGGAVVGEAIAVSEPAPSAPAPPPARAERPRAAAMAQAPAAAPAPAPPAESAAKATEAGELEDRRAVTGGTLGRAASEAFADTEDARRSTFRLDAGSASYDAVRRFLLDGRLPPAEAVRVEELVNAFDYGDAPPRDGDFALRLEGAPSPWASGERYYLLRVAVTARPPRTEAERVASAPVAQQVRAQVEFDPRSVARWRLLGYESQVVAEHRFRDERTGGGAIAGGHTATAVYELRLQPQAAPGAAVALLRLRWLPAGATRFAEAEQVLRASELVPYWEAASRGFRLATTVARFGEVLQGSHWVVGEDLVELARRAEAVAADWPRQERVRELARLVATAAELQRRRR
jgi:hypothetical protein